MGDRIRIEARSDEKFEERSRRYGWSGVIGGTTGPRSRRSEFGVFPKPTGCGGTAGGGEPHHPERREVGQQEREVRTQTPSKLGASLQTRWSLNSMAMVAGSSICRMVRDRFIADQQSCGLRRHLDSVPPDTPIREILDRCRVWESHSEQKRGSSPCRNWSGPGTFVLSGDSRELFRENSLRTVGCPEVQ